MQLNIATSIATVVLQELEPFCERIQIGGSIRRKKKEVKDIEIVCIPKQIETPGQIDLFGRVSPTMVRDPDFCKAVDQYKFVKGQSTGKYMVREDPKGHRIDIFTANTLNWGYILLLRTGSKDYNLQMIESLRGYGYQCKDGRVFKNDVAVPIREEEDIFRLCRMQYMQAEKRDKKVKKYHV